MVAIEASGPDFDATIATFVDELGFRLDLITPADDPRRAVLSRGITVVEVRRDGEVARLDAPMQVPPLVPALVISHPEPEDPVVGRAGMRYRDLIPGRLGGRFIASHIEVCDGGPVPDRVHHHAIRFQMIFCESGWVDVVYEDQGPPFRMHAGDGVLQPPHIRHKVLASSAGARVVEIGCPAEHDTLFDHELELPNDRVDATRVWSGQRFVRHVADEVAWHADEHGFETQITDIAEATAGLADCRVMRSVGRAELSMPIHDGEFDFVFVLDGSATAIVGDTTHELGTAAAMTVPPGTPWRLRDGSADLRLLSVRV